MSDLPYTNAFGEKIQIRVNKEMNSNTKLIILCHGFLSTMHNPPIEKLYTTLTKHNTVLSFDFIGKGKTFPTYTECSCDLFDIITYAQSQGVRDITLIGHSMGAVICLLLANKLRQTKLIHRLILISMPYDLREFRNRYRVPIFHKSDIQKSIHIREKVYMISREFIQDIYHYSIEKELLQVSIPTLVINGAQDTIVKAKEARKIYTTLFSQTKELKRKKQLRIIPTARHLYITKKVQQALSLEIEAFLIKYHD